MSCQCFGTWRTSTLYLGAHWGGTSRSLGRRAPTEIIEGRTEEAVDRRLDSLGGCAVRDRRSGSYARHLLTGRGDIKLSMPRTRRFCPTEVLKT